MRVRPGIALLLVIFSLVVVLVGCSRDPNVRKQKYLQSGTEYYQKEKYREAAIQFLNAIQVDSRYAEAHYQLAQCYLRLGIGSAAYQELLRTVDLQPDHWKAQVDLGNLLLGAREYKQAQERAELVLQKDPNNVDAHILLANSLAALQNLPASLREMQAAIQLAPDRPRSYLNLGALQLGAKEAPAAEQSFRKALALDPKSKQAVLALGNSFQSRSRWQEAEQQFRRAIELDPKDPVAWKALAMLYVAQHKMEEAERLLLQARKDLKDNSEGYRMLGDFYFSFGNTDKALAEYASLYQEHPQDLRVKKNYIKLLIVKDRLDEATKLNDEILKANAREVDALVYRGQILNRQNRSSDAIPVLEAAIKVEPDNAPAHYHLGVASAAVGNSGRAESEWREAVRLRPTMTTAHLALSEVALRKRDLDLLASSTEQLINGEPSSPMGYVLRAIVHRVKGDIAGAEADLKKAIEVAPQNPVGYSQMGQWRLAQKRFPEAEKLFEQALERDPNFAEALEGLLGVYKAQNQPAKALARVQAQIVKAPQNSAFHMLLGLAFMDAKDSKNAEAALQKAVELNQNNMDAFLLLAQVQAAQGSIDRAVASYERSIQRNPRDARMYVMLGALEETRGNWQKAQELDQKALQVQPDYPLAANNLAYLMLEHGGNVDVALTYAQVARRGLPDASSTADTLAWAYYHKGAYGSAIDLLQDAIKRAPQNATYLYHLGMAYWKNNDQARARQYLSRALELNPKFQKAAEIQQVLAQLK